MNAFVDKSQVEKQFSRAANSYNAAAHVQRQMSDQLIQSLDSKFKNKLISKITDLGCGTGLSLHELSKIYPEAKLTAVDISPLMLEQTKSLLPHANLVCADMEEYTTPDRQDLILSNASIQWCDFQTVANKVYDSLSTDGIFAFSSFGPHTHHELAKAWQQVDGSEHRIDFLNVQEHTELLKESGFVILQQQSDIQQLRFNSPEALLSSIKKTGATNAAKNRVRGLLSRERYRSFLAELEKNQPLMLSYETLSFVVQKP